MAEHSASQTLRDTLTATAERRGRKVHIQRVEDKLTPGIADFFACYSGTDFAVEMKHIKAFPARDSTVVKFDEPLKPEQLNWLENRQIAGGRSFVIARVARVGWYVFDKHFRILPTMTREEWREFNCFTTSQSLIDYILKEMENDYWYGRPLFAKV